MMWPFYPSLAALAIAGGILAVLLRYHSAFKNTSNRCLCWLISVVPFASGACYTFLAFPISAVLLWFLWKQEKEGNRGAFVASSGMIALALLWLFYGISIFWAADHGMAVMGLARFTPVLLLGVLLTGIESEQRREVYTLLPLSGVLMTLMSIPLMLLPEVVEAIAPDGRLAGFMEYPNTYALFLLICLSLQVMKEKQTAPDYIADAVLMIGVLASGSRTSFILMILVLLAGCGYRFAWKKSILLVSVTMIALAVSGLLDRLALLSEADRYMTTSVGDSTLLVRLLYFKDALMAALKYPMGFGYMGYPAMRGSFQTGVYHVSYVHNEILQLLMDVGWIPTLVLVFALFHSFFSKGKPVTERLIMAIIMAHAMMDFDFQFIAVWMLLVPLLEYDKGKQIRFSLGKTAKMVISAVLLTFCLWCGAGDLCYSLGRVDTCLKVMPTHTMAMQLKLTTLSDPDQLDELADRVLKQNEHSSIALSAKANAAFGRGEILSMMQYKERAIAENPYSLDDYTEYFDKTYEAMQLYLAAGDTESAQVCRERLLNIPNMLKEVEANTSPLAYQIQHKPELTLPEEYRGMLNALA